MGDEEEFDWVARENVRRYEKQIQATNDEDKRRVLRELLEQEIRKLDKARDH